MDGLWTIEFGSNLGVYGSGVLVLRDGTIQGGDGNYYYEGSYEESNASQFKAKIEVKPFQPDAVSIFRTYGQQFTLDLEGKLRDEGHAVAVGTTKDFPDQNVGIRLTRRSEAA